MTTARARTGRLEASWLGDPGITRPENRPDPGWTAPPAINLARLGPEDLGAQSRSTPMPKTGAHHHGASERNLLLKGRARMRWGRPPGVRRRGGSGDLSLCALCRTRRSTPDRGDADALVPRQRGGVVNLDIERRTAEEVRWIDPIQPHGDLEYTPSPGYRMTERDRIGKQNEIDDMPIEGRGLGGRDVVRGYRIELSAACSTRSAGGGGDQGFRCHHPQAAAR